MSYTCITTDLTESAVDSSIKKVNEIKFSIKSSGLSFSNRRIRVLKSTAITARIVGGTLQDENGVSKGTQWTISGSGWVYMHFTDNNSTIFITPKSAITALQIDDATSHYITIDWHSLLQTGINRLFTYAIPVDSDAIQKITGLTEWHSDYNQQYINFDVFKSFASMNNFGVKSSNVFGNTHGVVWNSLTSIDLSSTPLLQCQLSDFKHCSNLQRLYCNNHPLLIGDLSELHTTNPGNWVNLELNNSPHVNGNIKSIKVFTNLQTCFVGNTGVSGDITEFEGTRTSGYLDIRASDYMMCSTTKLVNNQYYTITFKSNNGIEVREGRHDNPGSLIYSS